MKNLLQKIQKKWKISLGIFLSLMLILSAIFRILTPPNYENTWENLNPGVNTANDLVTQLGQPDSITKEGNYQLYEYKNRNNATFNTQVAIADSNKTIFFVKERIKSDLKHTLELYTTKYGPPDLELYLNDSTMSVKAYVFLDEGIAIFAHQLDMTVEQKWYFVPTTKEVFLKSWKNELSTQIPGPEEF